MNALPLLFLTLTGCNGIIVIGNRMSFPNTLQSQPADGSRDSSASNSIESEKHSLISCVGAWFKERNYVCTTNASQNEIVACFSSHAIPEMGYLFSICADDANELLTFTVSAKDFTNSPPSEAVIAFLVLQNSAPNWGHFGLNPNGKIMFTVSQFHSDGKVSPEELDRLLGKSIESMDSAVKVLIQFMFELPEDQLEDIPKNEDTALGLNQI